MESLITALILVLVTLMPPTIWYLNLPTEIECQKCKRPAKPRRTRVLRHIAPGLVHRSCTFCSWKSWTRPPLFFSTIIGVEFSSTDERTADGS